MSLRIRNLLIRIETKKGPFGVQLSFADGMTVLRAPNTSGKSTCMEAIVYALGLEGMVSASQEVPLRQAVTEQIDTGEGPLKVLESSVYVEIENATGDRLTVHRAVVGPSDRRMVSVWNGAALSEPEQSYARSEYFVRVGGAATREAGFHSRLAQFMGWELPVVPRYEGTDAPLYLECLFPLFVIEQKKAWAVLPARFPQYLKIQEVAKRSLEFLLDLDAYRNAQKRREIEARVAELKALWRAQVDGCNRVGADAGAVVQNLSPQPVASWPPPVPAKIVVAKGNAWIPLAESLASDQERLLELESVGIPLLQQVSAEVQERLANSQNELAQREFQLREMYAEHQAEMAQAENAESRVNALEEDLRRYQDLARLREYGSTSETALSQGRCPTCHQDVSDSLLPQDPAQSVMSVEENIGFIKAQLEIFRTMKNEAEHVSTAIHQRIRSTQEEANGLRERIRTLRQSLVEDGRLPSLEAIEERLRLQRKVQDTKKANAAFVNQLAEFQDLSASWREAQDQLHSLPKGDISQSDRAKLSELQRLFIEQLEEYGLSSVDPNLLEISIDSYKPIREGFDIDFNNSASDLIRTHWAYITGLLEVARSRNTNHPGLLVLDEPRQQGTSWESFQELLKRLSNSISAKQQVIIATSEKAGPLEEALKGIPHKYLPFDGHILQPLQPGVPKR